MIELVVACGVLMLVLSSMAYVGTVAFKDAALARNRQTATALVNETLEQIRAMPFATVALGMSTTDIASGMDDEIVAASGVHRFRGERIPHGNNASIAPLVPHLVTRTVDGIAYEVGAYVTYLDDDVTSTALRITAIADWASTVRSGAMTRVEAQTIVYTGPGNDCSSSATHPFVAPCQPFLHASAESGQGIISITPNAADGGAMRGIDLEEAALWVSQQASGLQIEQVRSVTASGRTSGVSLRALGGDDRAHGMTGAVTASDSDPSQPKPEHDSEEGGPDPAATLSLSGPETSITVTTGAGATSTSASTVNANGGHPCGNALAIPSVLQTDSLPCGNATSQQLGDASMVIGLGSLGEVTMASIAAAPSSGVAHTTYDLAPQGSGASQSCPTTAGDGCAHASQRSSLGAIRVAGLPPAFAAIAPTGFDQLIRVDGSYRTVRAEAGVGSGAPSASTAGTISYWNGVGYTTTPIDGSPRSLAVAAVTVSDGTSSVSMQPIAVRAGATSAPTCAAPCASTSVTAESPVVADIRYTVVRQGTTLVDVIIHVDLGTLVAQASYTARPGA